MEQINKNEIITLLSVLYNYRINFSKAISAHNYIANKISKLPVTFMENDELSNLIIDETLKNNLMLIEKTKQLKFVNNALTKAKTLDEITKLMIEFNIFNLDKELLSTIYKQEKFCYSCMEKGYVTSQANNSFQDLNSSLNNMYSCIITQFKICEDFFNYTLAKMELNKKDDERNKQ